VNNLTQRRTILIALFATIILLNTPIFSMENEHFEQPELCCRNCGNWFSSSSAEKHRCKKKPLLFSFDDDYEQPKKKRKPTKKKRKPTKKKRKPTKKKRKLKQKTRMNGSLQTSDSKMPIIGEMERQMYNFLVARKRLSENK